MSAADDLDVLHDATVRDPLADWPAVLDARRRPMAERLELALSSNKLASELRVGLRAAMKRASIAER